MNNRYHHKYKAEVWDIMQLIFGQFNDHQIHFAIQFEEHIDEVRLQQAINLMIDAFPIIRCRFVENAGRPYWEETDFTAENIVFLKNTENIEHKMQKALCSKVDESVGPQLQVHVIRSEKFDSLCVVINHMICDGVGFKDLMYWMSSIYSHLEDDPDYKPDYQFGSRSAGQVLNSFHLKSKLAILFQKYGLSRHDDSVAFEFDGDRNNPFIMTRTIESDRFKAIKSYSKQQGVTINDVILAAYLRALNQVLPNQTAAIQCVLDLRKFLPDKKADAFCNLTSNLVCDIGPNIGGDFDKTLQMVKKVMDVEKARMSCLHLILLLEAVFGVLPYKMAKLAVTKEYHNPPLALSNIGIIDHKRLTFDHIKIHSAFITGSIKYNPLFQLALSTFDNEVTFSVAFHGTQADQKKIGLFLKILDKELLCLSEPVEPKIAP